MRDLVQAFSQFLIFSALSAERCIMPEYTVSSVDVQFCLRGFAFFGLFPSVEAWRHTICMQRSTPCRSEDISFLRDGAKCFSEFVGKGRAFVRAVAFRVLRCRSTPFSWRRPPVPGWRRSRGTTRLMDLKLCLELPQY